MTGNNNNDEAPIKAHSSVLATCSTVLKEKIKDAMFKSAEGFHIVQIDLDVSTAAIKAFVDCLYRKAIPGKLNQVDAMIRQTLNGY
jgi:hypothetical protein